MNKKVRGKKVEAVFNEDGDLYIISRQLFELACNELNHSIPIEQLKQWQDKYGNGCTYGTIMKLVEEWEKENE